MIATRNNSVRSFAILGVCSALLLALSTPAAAQAAAPPATAPAATQAASAESIQFRPRATEASSPRPSQAAADSSGLMRVGLSLGTVLLCIFGLRWAMKHIFGFQLPVGGARAIRILQRAPVGPRQQLMLIQVGRRIIFVANCGAQMNTLTEITDADEVAAVLSMSHGRPEDAVRTSFLSALGLARRPYDGEAAEDSPVSGQQAGAVQPPTEDSSATAADVAVADAKRELGGLLDRVRGLARRTGRA